MIRSWPSVLIGLGIPVVAVLLGGALLANTSVYVMGIPLLYFWVFLWFPLTTVCLWISWHVFDSRHYPSDEVAK